MDIEAGTLDLPSNTLTVNERHPFELSGTIAPTGFSYAKSDWPHLFIALYLSLDDVLDDTDYQIRYEMTSCQVNTLGDNFADGGTSNLKLDDMRKYTYTERYPDF